MQNRAKHKLHYGRVLELCEDKLESAVWLGCAYGGRCLGMGEESYTELTTPSVRL